ncbi:MAG: methyl-accepting chemotaxis protein [Spirochaetota bacterium]
MKIEKKIILITTLSCLISLLLYQGFYILHLYNVKTDSVAEFRRVLMANYDNDIKHQVENTVTMLDGLYKLHKAGKLSFEEAKYQGKELIRNIRYGKEGYFWIDTYEGINVMHAFKPEIEGKSRINSKDIKGKLLIKEIIENGRKQGGGFTDYYFTKGSGTVPFPKRGYSLNFEPFEWVLGTGNYLDDIEATIELENKYYTNEIQEKLLISIGVFLVLVFFSIITARRYARKFVTKPVQKLVKAFRDLAEGEGDLTKRIDFNSSDELSDLANSFNGFTENIAKVIKDVRLIADALASAATEMHSSTDGFSENSQGQASSAEEATASTEEVSAEVDNVAALAAKQSENLMELQSSIRSLTAELENLEAKVNESRDITNDIAQNSDYGIKSLNEMNETMTRIQGSSMEMVGIVSIINDISDQINLLSLNAAIESARAGEAGRGFAVVSDEISKLADQTAGSINDISRLIKTNNAGITKGIEKLNIANTKIGDILKAVSSINSMIGQLVEIMKGQARTNKEVNTGAEKVKDMADEIRSRTGQQKSAMEEIVTVITKIGELTQSSASGALEMAATSRELSLMAKDLNEKVSFFKV